MPMDYLDLALVRDLIVPRRRRERSRDNSVWCRGPRAMNRILYILALSIGNINLLLRLHNSQARLSRPFKHIHLNLSPKECVFPCPYVQHLRFPSPPRPCAPGGHLTAPW